MGDPRKLKNKYSKPKKILDKARIEEDSRLKYAYGLKNMRELWIASQELKKARREARRLLSLTESQRKAEENIVLSKLQRLGILNDKSRVEDVLSLTVKDVLERRLQTRVLRKGLAKTMPQARQLITHGFIAVGERRINVPSYLVSDAEDKGVRYYKKIEIEHNMVEAPKQEAKAEAAKPAAEAAPAAPAA
jgi:small subunit ribosomal protein S4